MRKSKKNKIHNMVLKTISFIVSAIFIISISSLDSDTTLFYYIGLGCLAYFYLLAWANNWGYKEDNDEQN
jgi:hypothetical protein